MAAASSLAILLWMGTYVHLSSPVLYRPDRDTVERALATEARIGPENFDFWRSKGLRLADTIFLKPDPDGVLLDDVQAYRSNLLIRHSLPKSYIQVGVLP